jgi:hypothetical protein
MCGAAPRLELTRRAILQKAIALVEDGGAWV